ncbi:MAG: hypothetical protein NZ826_07510, partial [Thermodesulfovibrio sp.]|nr:hypothetical protein [Thermodesulfovibrio sp.]
TVDSAGRERLLRDINTYEYFKVTHTYTSRISFKVEQEHCQPILHDDKGYIAQRTYHGFGRVATESLESLKAQVKWSCPALPCVYKSKTRSYRVYNKNY